MTILLKNSSGSKMKSNLLLFYKFSAELAANCVDHVELEIGLPEKEFNQLKAENYGLLTKFNADDFKDANEFIFNTGHGTLLIYNKDLK